jgi:hypothetical protein
LCICGRVVEVVKSFELSLKIIKKQQQRNKEIKKTTQKHFFANTQPLSRFLEVI